MSNGIDGTYTSLRERETSLKIFHFCYTISKEISNINVTPIIPESYNSMDDTWNNNNKFNKIDIALKLEEINVFSKG